MAGRNVINIEELTFMDFGDGGKFSAQLGRIGPLVGARDLGYNITVVPPGKRAFPFHLHHAMEEMFFILEGEGVLRYNDEESAIKKGDVVACPTGPGTAHQIINTGEVEMKYLAVSTCRSPDVVEYPDSGKVAAMAGDFSNRALKMDLRLIVNKESAVGYFEGESE